MMGCLIIAGGTYYQEVDIVEVSGDDAGLPVNADSTPTIEIVRNGIVVGSPPTITITHPVTGRYVVTFVVPTTWNSGDNVDVYMTIVLHAVTYRSSIGGFMVVLTPADINPVPPPAISRTSLDLVYGVSNIDKWADADNTEDDAEISNRVNWAVNKARLYIEGRLAKRFAVPFDPLPSLVIEMIAEKAGAILFFSPRGNVEGDPEVSVMSQHNKSVDNMIAAVLAGTLKLVDAIKIATEIPKAVNDCSSISPFLPFTQIASPFDIFPNSFEFQPVNDFIC